MSSPNNNFLTLIPAAHRVAVISPFTASEEIIPALQKTRRSSSTATTESNSAAEEPALPSENADIVESPTTDVNTVDTGKPAASGFTFLKLGN